MPQVSELLVKVKDAEARLKLSQVDQEVQNLQQRFAKGFTVTTDTKGLDTVVSKFKEIIDGEERLVTLRQKEVETAKAEYDEAGNLIKARQTAIQQTKTVSTNYAEIERHNKQILKDTNALADAQRRLANSLTGTIREKYLNGTFSAERATGAQNQYNAFLSRDFDEVQRAQERVLASQSVFSQLSDQTFVAYATGAMSADEANKSLASSTEEVGNKARKTGGQFTLLNTILLRLAHTAISALTRAFREALTEMKNVDTQLTTISRITQTNISDLDALKNKAYEVGNQYGVLASDYLSAAAAFTRAGYREQAEDLAELSSKMQIAGQVSAETANQLLIATDKAYGFNGSVTELSAVMDKMTVIDHNYATSVEKIAEGIGLVAPIASQAHMSMDELIAAMGTITAVTQRSGSESARALRALILSIIKDTTTEIEEGVTWTVEEINTLQDALKTYAPTVVAAAEATGTLIDPMEAIAALSKAYEEGLLTEAKLADITSKLGGKLRASQLLSLIQNYSGMYTQMMSDMGNAIGAVDKDVDKALQSWEVKLNQLKNTFTKFVQDSLDTNFIKGLIDSVNWLITGFGNLGTVLGIVAGAFVALNITRIVGWFTNLGKSVSALGGGFKNLILVLTNYKTASKAGAVGTESFNTALEGTSLAASVAQIAITALAVAISAAIIAYNKIDQSQKEKAEASEKLAKATGEESKRLDELYQKYLDAKDGSEQQKKASDELREALDLEAGSVENLSDKYKELTAEKRKQSAADYYDSVLDRENLLRRNLNPFTSIFGGKIGKSSKIDLNKMFNDSQSGVAIRDMLGIYAGDWNEIFAKYNKAESNAENLIGLYTDINALLDKMKVAREKGDSVPEQGFNILKNWATQSEEYVNAYEDSWKSYVQAKAYEDAWSDSTIKNIKTQEDFDAAIKKASQSGIRGYGDAMKVVLEQMFPQFATKTEEVTEAVEEQADSIDGLTKKLEGATEALKNYKKALEGGEKGDNLKSYADAYKSAVDLFQKGLTGTNAYMSAMDLLFTPEQMRELGWDYEKAGEMLSKPFFKAMFEGGGEDFGANAANYIRTHPEVFEGVVTKMTEDGKFSLMVTDMEAFARSAEISSDALYVLLEALDAYDSSLTLTNEEIEDLIKNVASLGEDGTRTVNLSALISQLANDGKTEREIYQIVDAIKELAKIDGTIKIEEPENLDETIQSVLDLKDVADEENKFDVVVSTNADEVFDGIKKEIKQLDGSTIYIGLKYKEGYISNRDKFKFFQADRFASGTESSRGGLALVNDGDGAELIAANGKAWIAGGGEPTITNLPVGAQVFNAKQTREIFSRSGINAFSNNVGIPTNPSGNSYSNKLTKSTKSLEKILDELEKYIEKILKKAKDALDAQLKAIDAQIEALEREHNAEEDKNKLEELRLKVLEAEKRLEEAKNERTVRYFNKETGQWEWMADQKAVYEAEQALKEAQEAYDKEVAEQAYQAQIQALKDLKQALQDQYDDLADHWEEIYNALKESGESDVNFEKLLKSLGLDKNTTGDIRELIKAILEYEKKMESGSYDMPLDSDTVNKILGAFGTQGTGTNTVGQIFGISTADSSAKGTSLYSTASSIVGDTIYYINGLKIGADMMDKPLSEILSRLSIYAN